MDGNVGNQVSPCKDEDCLGGLIGQPPRKEGRSDGASPVVEGRGRLSALATNRRWWRRRPAAAETTAPVDVEAEPPITSPIHERTENVLHVKAESMTPTETTLGAKGDEPVVEPMRPPARAEVEPKI